MIQALAAYAMAIAFTLAVATWAIGTVVHLVASGRLLTLAAAWLLGIDPGADDTPLVVTDTREPGTTTVTYEWRAGDGSGANLTSRHTTPGGGPAATTFELGDQPAPVNDLRQSSSKPGSCLRSCHAVGRVSLFILFTAMTVAIVVLALRLRDERGPLDAEAAALELVRDGVAQEPRREGDRWEVDVVRPDGSMVEVSLSNDLDVRGFDEEIGPAGTLAADELRGAARVRAVRAAFREIGPGEVVSVEYDAQGIEVRIRTGARRQQEVELDRNFRLVEIDDESLTDE